MKNLKSWSILFCLLQQLYLTCQRGLIVIPGLGRPDRLLTVKHNILKLEKQLELWDCLIYVYAYPNDTAFWSMKSEYNEISTRCDIVETPGKRVTENLYMVQPSLIRRAYSHVFILLDDCKLSDDGVELISVLKVMEANNLTVISPKVVGANRAGGQKFRNIMQADAQPNTLGYVSMFVELFAWVATLEAYQALWELLYPAVNPYGWGYDLWYDCYARTRVRGHKMGILSTWSVLHDQDLSGLGRTESASMDIKWQAVHRQEELYWTHFGVNLGKCRKEMPLKDRSVFGAVTGYLRPVDGVGEFGDKETSGIGNKRLRRKAKRGSEV